MRAFTYSAVRLFVDDAYAGTILNMSFEPERGGNWITYSRTVHIPDQSLDDLRDHVARVVAGKMATKVNSGQSVRWTSQMSFESGELHCKPTGWFGSKPEQLVSYGDIGSYEICEGAFYLWLRDEENR